MRFGNGKATTGRQRFCAGMESRKDSPTQRHAETLKGSKARGWLLTKSTPANSLKASRATTIHQWLVLVVPRRFRPRTRISTVTRSRDPEVRSLLKRKKLRPHTSLWYSHPLRYQAKSIILNCCSPTPSALHCYRFSSIVNYLCGLLHYCNFSSLLCTISEKPRNSLIYSCSQVVDFLTA